MDGMVYDGKQRRREEEMQLNVGLVVVIVDFEVLLMYYSSG